MPARETLRIRHPEPRRAQQAGGEGAVSLIGLTATLAPQTIACFHQNCVVEYNHEHGGLGKAHQLFGEQLPKLLEEVNDVLAA